MGMDLSSSTPKPVITDFDISRSTESTLMTMTCTSQGCGTLLYMAPEIQPLPLGKGERHSQQSDIFAFGMVVFRSHFPGANSEDVTQLVEAESKDLKDLLSITLATEPAERSTATALLRHPYLALDSIVRDLEAKRAAEEAKRLEEREAERERARQESEAHGLAEEALQRDCCICFDSFRVTAGVECSAAGGHFMCNECFTCHVEAEATADGDLLAKRDGCVFCPNRNYGCASSAFEDITVAQHVTPEAF